MLWPGVHSSQFCKNIDHTNSECNSVIPLGIKAIYFNYHVCLGKNGFHLIVIAWDYLPHSKYAVLTFMTMLIDHLDHIREFDRCFFLMVLQPSSNRNSLWVEWCLTVLIYLVPTKCFVLKFCFLMWSKQRSIAI